tara:strand:- start:3599 stop:6580 length:2982 start_codon:yes stop_codon:yes gene_type:complete
MGGLAGHMSHLYDNPELSFEEIEDIFTKASSGSLIGTEKTDGQNIFLSYSVKDGEARAARNIGNIKTGGMSAAELAKKFAGRGNLTKSFTDAFAAFEKAVELFDLENQIDIFGPDANIWYNAEVQDPRTSNVINYDAKALTIHRVGHKEFDKQSGRPVDKDVSANAKKLEKSLDSIKNLIDNEEYRVQMNAFRNLTAISDDEILNIALSRLYDLMKSNGMEKDNTVGDFVAKRVKAALDSLVPNASEEARQELLRRVLKEKGASLNRVLKLIPKEEEKLRDKIRGIVKRDKKIAGAAIHPLEDIVHDFSVEALRGLESAFVLDNETEVQRLKKEVSRAIAAIEKSDSEEAMSILSRQMKKLKDVENVSTAAEGFVFDYDGNSYKFTGNFAPVNQLLGLFRYGRGNVPPMKITEEDSDVEDNPSPHKADVAFVPGSFKPPHVGHFELMKSYLDEANKVVILISDPQKDTSMRFIDVPDMEKHKIEFTPDASKRIFDLYTDNENLEGKIEVWDIWNKGFTNPIQFVHEYLKELGEDGERKKVALGVSTKDKGDEKRFIKMKQDFAKYPNLELEDIPKEPLGAISATDMRTAITNVMAGGDINQLQQFIPDGVNAETLLNIVASQPTWITESRVKEIVALIDAPADYKGKELMFHEMMEFYMKAPEDVRNAFEEAIDTMTPDEIRDYLLRWKKANLEEISTMASGAVQGSAGTNEEESLIREEEEEMSEHTISRKDFIEELNVREHVRSVLGSVLKDEQVNEVMVRHHIRQMIAEEVKDAPYKSTGINELETLLKKIIPVIEPDYKSLTTASEQRVSYRAHILNAVQNSLSPTGAGGAMNRDDIDVIDAPTDAEFELEEDVDEDIAITVGDTADKFIDIDDKPAKETEEEEEASFSVEGEEETGRNFASMTWDRIETNIVDSYRKLSNEKDKDLFYDYLIANLKLYFDKFEDELATIVDEPASEIYDQEIEDEGDELSMDDENIADDEVSDAELGL